MTRARKVWIGLGVTLVVLALVAAVLVRMIPSDEELAQRTSAELEAALGVPVSVAALHWQLFPVPTVTIENAATRQPQPVEVKKLTAHLNKSALWQRRLKVDRAEVQGAVLPQLSLRGLAHRSPSDGSNLPAKFTVDEVPLARIEFQEVTWISRRGIRTVYDGHADFDAGWRPRTAQLRRSDTKPAADLTLTRLGQDDRWDVRVNLGGGTVNGQVQLQPGAKGGLQLAGKLQPRNIEVDGALQAFHRRSIVAGRASGHIVLSASGDTFAALAQSLRTSTSFSMSRATLLRFDLDKAIRSAGQDHAGTTQLDAVSGQLDTQNTPDGMVVDYSKIKVTSGALSASGKARVANRRIDAEFAVDIVDGMVGVPLKISGPMDQVRVSVPASALAGAAVGTAILPGVGTALGARIGAAIGQIFGAEPAGKKSPPLATRSR